MKTFTDAVRLCILEGDGSDEAQKLFQLKELHGRYESLADEAGTDERLTAAIFAWFDMIVDSGANGSPEDSAYKICELLFTAFMSGLVTGIEMEKEDPASFARTQGAATHEPEPRKAPTENNTGEIA